MMLTSWKEPDVRFTMQQLKYNRGIQNCDYLKSVHLKKKKQVAVILACVHGEDQVALKSLHNHVLKKQNRDKCLSFLLCSNLIYISHFVRYGLTQQLFYVTQRQHPYMYGSVSGINHWRVLTKEMVMLIMFAGCCCTVWITHKKKHLILSLLSLWNFVQTESDSFLKHSNIWSLGHREACELLETA